MLNIKKHYQPDNLIEALSLTSKLRNFKLIAGGTDLIVKLKEKILDCPILVDLGNISEFKGIKIVGNKLHIGSLTTMTEIEHSDIIKKYAYGLSKAAGTVGAVQIRNRATIGGNICNASPSGDTIPALYALEAEFKLYRSKGARYIKIDKFFKGPGKTELYSNEILGFIVIPLNKNLKTEFFKVGQRNSMAISKLSMAVAYEYCEKYKKFYDIKIAFGAVGPTVLRALATEKLLKEKEFNKKLLDKAVETSKKDVKPISDIRSSKEYRKEVCAMLLKKFLEIF